MSDVGSAPVFAEVLPMLAARLAWELEEYPALAAQVPELRIVGRCECGQPDCQTLDVAVPDRVARCEDPGQGVLSAGLGCDLATVHVWDGRIHHIQMLGAECFEPAIAAAFARSGDE